MTSDEVRLIDELLVLSYHASKKPGRNKVKLLKSVLFGSFWSFLLIFSGIVDIAIGIIILTGVLSVRHAPFPVFIVCFIVGLIYIAAGLGIAIAKIKKQAA